MTKEQPQPTYTEKDLAKIRNSEWLKELWDRFFLEGGLRGRTWGRKRKVDNGPLRGSHVTLGQVIESEGGNHVEEIIILNVSRDGKLQLHEFNSTKGTALGNQVRSLLEENGWIISEDQK